MELKTNISLGFDWEYGATGETPEGFKNANEYSVTFSRNGLERSFDFFKGKANTSEPEAVEVLECLVLDFIYSDGVTFEDWADELGFNSDSRKAYANYENTLVNNIKLLDLFSRPELQELYDSMNEN
jgi:hypothetical protein